jgi:hypothetical protein
MLQPMVDENEQFRRMSSHVANRFLEVRKEKSTASGYPPDQVLSLWGVLST